MRRPSSSRPFGSVGQASARLFELTNACGHVARISDYGATLVELHLPDRNGKVADVVLGFDDVAGYLSGDNQSFGCTMGRVTNRIGGASFEIDGERFELDRNNGPNHIHGGSSGRLGRKLWRVLESSACALTLQHTSPDGEEGYPGRVEFEVHFELSDTGELRIEYSAVSDRITPINLTNHSYWNLAGAGSGSVFGQELKLNSLWYTPVDEHLLPTGELDAVEGTPFDFGEFRALGPGILELGASAAGGYDHNLVLQPGEHGEPTYAGSLRDPGSGRRFDLHTTERGLQLYTGNGLKGQIGKLGRRYGRYGGCCLEAQNWPDAVNRADFPRVLLAPGETYRQVTLHRFGVE